MLSSAFVRCGSRRSLSLLSKTRRSMPAAVTVTNHPQQLSARKEMTLFSSSTKTRAFSTSFIKSPFTYVKKLFGWIDPEQYAKSLEDLSNATDLWKRGNLERALSLYRKGAVTLEQEAPNSELLGHFYLAAGSVLITLGDNPKEAILELEKAAAILEWVAPNTLLLRDCYRGMGNSWYDLGDLDKALSAHRKALEANEQQEPVSPCAAKYHHVVGYLLQQKGNLKEAMPLLRSAVEIVEQKDPGSLDEAKYRNTLGCAMQDQGDIVGASQEFNKALAIQESKAPNSLDVANTYVNIALTSHGGLDGVIAAFRKANAIFESKDPNSTEAIGSSALIAAALERQGDLEGSLVHFRKVLAFHESQDPHSAPAKSFCEGIAEVERELQRKRQQGG